MVTSRQGHLIWLIGGPSVGKSSVARAIQRAGGVDDSWVLAGDHHFLRTVPADRLVRYGEPIDPEWQGWSIPSVDHRILGRPRAGSRALRLLDGMYRSAAAMALAGNNVVLEDVVWESTIASIALAALSPVDPFVVRLVCSPAMAVDRERARADRFNGAAMAYASEPEMVEHVDMTVDSAELDPRSIAQKILARVDARKLHH